VIAEQDASSFIRQGLMAKLTELIMETLVHIDVQAVHCLVYASFE